MLLLLILLWLLLLWSRLLLLLWLLLLSGHVLQCVHGVSRSTLLVLVDVENQTTEEADVLIAALGPLEHVVFQLAAGLVGRVVARLPDCLAASQTVL